MRLKFLLYSDSLFINDDSVFIGDVRNGEGNRVSVGFGCSFLDISEELVINFIRRGSRFHETHIDTQELLYGSNSLVRKTFFGGRANAWYVRKF